ncbi:diadenylate cyclase CdaA [Anaerostipes butyraticus]|uniref:diadenylate cyclase CdaA n=1 Tax=Anaerostipes butyraticus TaxID=645466 RepID=UPI0035EFBE3A
MLNNIVNTVGKYLYWLSIPRIGFTDVLDILIVSILFYQIVKWIKTTRAWVLLKGIILLLCIALAAYLLQLHTITFILANTMSVGITAVLIVFQPELRSALEQLGRKNWIANIFSTDTDQVKEGYTARTLQEIYRAAIEMGKVKTGALIVIEREVMLGEYERTGIPIDGKVSSQLLINIFEHNTPLHDGAVIIRNNRIVSATCYLPLSDSVEIGKELGTRHRAAVGISEVSDSITVIVSEETGDISIAVNGKIKHALAPQEFRDELSVLREENTSSKKFKLWKGLNRNERKNRE